MSTHPDSDQQAVSRRQTLRVAGAAAATVATAGASIPAAAYHEGQTLEGNEGFFGGNEVVTKDDRLAAVIAGGKGSYRRIQMRFEDLSDAETIAADLQTHLNDNSADYLAYVNERDLGGDDYEVLQLTLVQADQEVPLYLVAEYDPAADGGAGAYQSLELLAAETYESEHGDREHDEAAILEGHAAKEAPADLERLHEEFIAPNEDISTAFGAEMASKYGESTHVSSTLLGDDL